MKKKFISHLYSVLNKFFFNYKDQDIVFITDENLSQQEFNLLIKQINWYLCGLKVFIYSKKYKNFSTSTISCINSLPNEYLPVYTSYKQFFSFLGIKNKFNGLIVDKNFYLASDAKTLRAMYFIFSSDKFKRKLLEISIANYKKFSNMNRDPVSTCFLTGPSIEKFKDVPIAKNGFKIICNSIVKNTELLEYINGPDIVVFADPVFHFSINDYCVSFRRDLMNVFKKYKPYIGVPIQSMHIYLKNFPFLEDYLIGFNISKKFSHPSPLNNLEAQATSNILTMLMLPLASSISDEINIIGADGRDPNEKYFWQHNSTTQYSDDMKSVFDMHPSFLNDYDIPKYYNDHIQFLEKQISFGENMNKKYYSLTHSYIPALKKRMKYF